MAKVALIRFRVRHVHNPRAVAGQPFGAIERRVLSEAGCDAARREIERWPGYAPTPLLALDGLARAIGVAKLWYKDESERFGLGSFKALGGAYAVLRVIADELEHRNGIDDVTSRALMAGKYRRLTKHITVATATDGNHGRSVAWGAEMLGARAVIFIHRHVSVEREAAIARFGAEVVRVDGNYDDSVREAARQARIRGWHVISDTSWRGYQEVPRQVMHGYTVLANEAVDQLGVERPSHVLAQGGVGGLAAALFARLWMRWGAARPRLVVVEPETADCLFRSAKAGRPTKVPGNADTLMAGLACGEVSRLAWRLLARAADDFIAVPDDAAIQAMRVLAKGIGGDQPIVAGESGVAGLAGLLALAARPRQFKTLDLGPTSKVLVIGSEGDTDPDLYRELVGRRGDEVRASAFA